MKAFIASLVPEEYCETVRNIFLPEKTPLELPAVMLQWVASGFPGWPAGGPRREPGSSNWPLETVPCVGWNQPRAVAELKLMSSFMGTRCWEAGLAL